MNKSTLFNAIGISVAVAVVAACGQQAQQETDLTVDTAAEEHAAPVTSIYADAVANASRPEADRARDAGRKPAEMLEFFGIEPGMKVLDMFSGGGWYAEIVSHLVGEEGHVTAHTNSAYIGFVGNALQERFDGERISNVDVLLAENNELELQENSLDAVMMVQTFHDIYHSDPEGGWEEIDGVAFLAEIKKGLKPGGIVAIIDHTATAGAAPETGDSLHRIDPDLVLANMEAAGFLFEASSDALKNSQDELKQMVFADGIRGKTDRFAMLFRNPK